MIVPEASMLTGLLRPSKYSACAFLHDFSYFCHS